MTGIALLKECPVACRLLRCRLILNNVLDDCYSSPASLYSIVIAVYVLLHYILDVSSYDTSSGFFVLPFGRDWERYPM